jgi:selenobiotic family peptide radical SAM maturase
MTKTRPTKDPDTLFPLIKCVVGKARWGLFTGRKTAGPQAAVPSRDLFRIEAILREVASRKTLPPRTRDTLRINPALEIVELKPRILPLFKRPAGGSGKGTGFLLVWREPGEAGALRAEAATSGALLVLKMIAEGIPTKEVALTGGVTLCSINDAVREAVQKGLLLKPVSKLRRNIPRFCNAPDIPERLLAAEFFTLQWHITHACDLHCKHCYDRTERSSLTPAEGIRLLDGLKKFCGDKHVWGHVCFSGGNPFMSPHFFKWYKAAAERGFATSILGNPVSREALRKMTEIQRPRYFQVSLEGLADHNDFIRGKDFFVRIINFLALLKEQRVPSAVMLTLTKSNRADVLPLAAKLRGVADYFTFNRLSGVGEGAKLASVPPADYAAFLEDYIKASEDNTMMGFKDNLINVALAKKGDRLFSGCTGYGCGAAFNFVAVLPDGEVHACRKFPSPLGYITRNSLLEIYDSAKAERYREGTNACRSCALKPRCGGCLAVTKAAGLNIFIKRDPYCFMDDRSQKIIANHPGTLSGSAWSDCH